MKRTKNLNKMASVASIVLLIISLTGCSGMMRQFGFEPIKDATLDADKCANASVLITNLNEDENNRQYQTVDGQTCPGVNNGTKTETEENSN
ncbi:MAG: hypothetical protein K2Q14_04775 [Gammaproteobacteria bacterium]|nr:hypothetical protein [Gammaproteobacteria bacterium]MBY0544846.1 hypothetical protein [Gammaproteobacteria bacterium]